MPRLLFKTVVAGDSWGLIAIPVIQVGSPFNRLIVLHVCSFLPDFA